MKAVDFFIGISVALMSLIVIGIIGQVLGWCWISPAC